MYKASPRYEIPLTKEHNKPARLEPRTGHSQAYCLSGCARGLTEVPNTPMTVPATNTHRLLGIYSAKNLGGGTSGFRQGR